MAKKNALGKGMASLLQANASPSLEEDSSSYSGPIPPHEKEGERPSASTSKDHSDFMGDSGTVLIDVDSIVENPYQPRKIFNEQELEELGASIKENGLVQPIIVCKGEKGFELIAGERRWRASKKAGLTKIPAIIRRATDQERLVLAIIENVQRADLNCVEEGLAYQQLMEDFHLTQEEVAKKVGKERSSVANFLRILRLPKGVLEQVKGNVLSFGHAKVLASLKNPDLIKSLAEEVVQNGLSVRDLEKRAEEMQAPKVLPGSSGKQDNFNEKLDQLRRNLEHKTGFHFQMKWKKNGSGQITINFHDKVEFNKVYDYLLK